MTLAKWALWLTASIEILQRGYRQTEALETLTYWQKPLKIFKMEYWKRKKDFSAIASIEDIAKQDYILIPGRYVGIEEQEDDGEPFEEKMTRLTSELSDMFKKSHELEEEIRKKLGAIGYEV